MSFETYKAVGEKIMKSIIQMVKFRLTQFWNNMKKFLHNECMSLSPDSVNSKESIAINLNNQRRGEGFVSGGGNIQNVRVRNTTKGADTVVLIR